MSFDDEKTLCNYSDEKWQNKQHDYEFAKNYIRKLRMLPKHLARSDLFDPVTMMRHYLGNENDIKQARQVKQWICGYGVVFTELQKFHEDLVALERQLPSPNGIYSEEMNDKQRRIREMGSSLFLCFHKYVHEYKVVQGLEKLLLDKPVT